MTGKQGLNGWSISFLMDSPVCVYNVRRNFDPALIQKDSNLVLLDDKVNCSFPDSISSTNKNEVYVGHIRPDHSLPPGIGWNFWISGDQILRGAAYNAVEILNKFIHSQSE